VYERGVGEDSYKGWGGSEWPDWANCRRVETPIKVPGVMQFKWRLEGSP